MLIKWNSKYRWTNWYMRAWTWWLMTAVCVTANSHGGERISFLGSHTSVLVMFMIFDIMTIQQISKFTETNSERSILFLMRFFLFNSIFEPATLYNFHLVNVSLYIGMPGKAKLWTISIVFGSICNMSAIPHQIENVKLMS